MSEPVFPLALLVAAALLAAWLFVRFPRLVPESARGVTAGILGAVAVFVAVPPAIMVVGQPLGAVPAAFLVALPGCIYLFLSALWLMAYVRRAIAPFLK